jgi:hypothetical protein
MAEPSSRLRLFVPYGSKLLKGPSIIVSLQFMVVGTPTASLNDTLQGFAGAP